MNQVSGAINVRQLDDLIVHLWRASAVSRYCPVLVWGEAGIGKSETVAAASRKLGIGFKDLRLGLFEAPDLLGVPRQQEVYPCFLDFEEGADPRTKGRLYTAYGLWARLREHYQDRLPTGGHPNQVIEWAVSEARKKGLGGLFAIRTVNSPPSWLPQPGTAGILFLDELNRSQKDVRQGVFQLILDRKIGLLELPKRWIIVAAVNPPKSADESGAGGYEVADMSDKAFLSRFCHQALEPDATEWMTYARNASVDPKIRAFVAVGGDGKPAENGEEKADLNERRAIILGSASPTQIPELEPTPRSWVLLSKVISDIPAEGGAPAYKLDPELVVPVSVGLIGVHATRVWFAMRMVPDKVVTVDDLISDYAAGLVRMRKFLSYPLYNPETGEPQRNPSGGEILTRRSDLVQVTFESVWDRLREEKKKPVAERNPYVVAAALRLAFDGLVPDDEGGLSMTGMSFQYLKKWLELLPPNALTAPPPAYLEAYKRIGVDHNQIMQKLRDIRQMQGFQS